MNKFRDVLHKLIESSLNEDISPLEPYLGHRHRNLVRTNHDIIKTLENSLNLKISKYLGSGFWGTAFLTDKKTTVKVTADRTEAAEALRILNSKPVHLPQVYHVFKIKVKDEAGFISLFVIEKEFILQNNNYVKLLDGIWHTLSHKLREYYRFKVHKEMEAQTSTDEKYKYKYFPIDTDSLVRDISIDNINEEDIKDFLIYCNDEDKKLNWLVTQIYSICKEGQKLNIAPDDLKPANLGIKNKKLIYIDFGASANRDASLVDAMGNSAEMNEDDNWDNLKSKADIFHRGFYQRPLSVFLDILKNKLNLDIQSYLGDGSWGVAFKTSDNKTVKITGDKSEAVEALKIKNNNLKHIPEIYAVHKLEIKNNLDVYVIIKDFTLQNKKFKKFLYDLFAHLNGLVNMFRDEYPKFRYKFNERTTFLIDSLLTGEISQKEWQQFSEYAINNTKHKYVPWLLNQVYEIIEELRGLGISYADIKPDNLGLKGRNLVFFDIGGANDEENSGIDSQKPLGVVDENN